MPNLSQLRSGYKLFTCRRGAGFAFPFLLLAGAASIGRASGLPLAVVSTSSLDFGSDAVGYGSPVQTLTLNNTGGSLLSIVSILLAGANPGDFWENDSCGGILGGSLAPGGSCTITVLFQPTAVGTRTASLTIASDSSGGLQIVTLSGTGAHDVIVTWSQTPGVIGYNVYRGTTPGGETATPQDRAGFDGTVYIDANNIQPGHTYYYVVTAIGPDGTESAHSQEVSATVPE